MGTLVWGIRFVNGKLSGSLRNTDRTPFRLFRVWGLEERGLGFLRLCSLWTSEKVDMNTLKTWKCQLLR